MTLYAYMEKKGNKSKAQEINQNKTLGFSNELICLKW